MVIPLRLTPFTLRRDGMTAVEAAIVVALIGAFLGAATVYHVRLLHRAKELALRADLQSLRASVDFFQARRGRLPETLEAVFAEPIGSLKLSGNWLPPRDERGALVDPFRRPYRYEPKGGMVTSTTPGYETW